MAIRDSGGKEIPGATIDKDGTVRDANCRIIQFAYGEDGIDVSRSENGKINVQRIIDSVK